eukprot:1071391-Amphidinium_carterae.1
MHQPRYFARQRASLDDNDENINKTLDKGNCIHLGNILSLSNVDPSSSKCALYKVASCPHTTANLHAGRFSIRASTVKRATFLVDVWWHCACTCSVICSPAEPLKAHLGLFDQVLAATLARGPPLQHAGGAGKLRVSSVLHR